MKRRLTIVLIAIVAAALILYLGLEGKDAPPDFQQRSVLLVTDDDTGWFYLQLKEGAEAACRERGAQLRAMSVAGDELCDMEEAKKAAGVVLFLSSPHIRKQAEDCALQQGIPYRSVLGQGEKGVHMDEKAGGALLARMVPANHTLSMVYSREDETTRRRIEGAQDALPGIVPLKMDPAGDVPRELFFARAVIAMDERATTMLAERKEEGRLPSSLLLFGYDTGARRIRDLESGTVYAMMMPVPYALGHAAVRSLLSGRPPLLPTGKAVTQRSMFLSENVRLMFPLIQN